MAKTLRAIVAQERIQLENYRSKGSFEKLLTSEMEKIEPKLSEENPNLVVFPEHIGTPLAVIGSMGAVRKCKTLEEAISKIAKSALDSVLAHRLRYRTSIPQAIFLSKESVMRKTYESVFSKLSERYNTYILAGTVVVPFEQKPTLPEPLQAVAEIMKKKKLHNTAYLFGPNGDVLLQQRKVNLIPLEKEDGLDLSPGEVEDLQPYDIEGITIGVTICYDAFHPEITKHLAENGAKVLVDPCANPERWTKETAEENMQGLFARVQDEEGIMYGVQAMLTGTLFDITFEGRSSIVTKKENTQDMTGMICQAGSKDQPEILVADLTT